RLLFAHTAAAAPPISTLSLHDALPIWRGLRRGVGSASARLGSRRVSHTDHTESRRGRHRGGPPARRRKRRPSCGVAPGAIRLRRSEEHTSELQSRENLVCRLLLEKKKK